MDKTKKILVEMLKENAGSYGSGYGKPHWQLNQIIDFDKTPASSVKFEIYNDKPEILVTHSIYHWLASRLEYNHELTKLFYSERFSKFADAANKYFLEQMEIFPEWLGTLKTRQRTLKYGTPTGFYHQGEPNTINTYNGEELLSQILQFVYFENDSGEYVILQIHNGADARCGYTAPRVFSVDNCYDLPMFDYHKGLIYCSREGHHETALGIKEFQEKQLKLPGFYVPDINFEHDRLRHWYSENGCDWTDEGSCGTGYKNLEDFEAKNLEEDDVWEPGKLCIKDGVGYCPTCGAKLESGF